MKSHEYANIFPMMSDIEIARLAEDIKQNGLSDPIITLDGKILDGRNRFKACGIAETEPRFESYDGTDPLAFVMSHNLHRRNLSESQRAMVAAKWAKLKNGCKPPSPIGEGQQSETATRDEAAKIMNIGTSSIDRAKKVIKDAPELVAKIESGEMSVNAAYVSTKTPHADADPVVVDGTKPDADTDEAPKPKPQAKSSRLPAYMPNDADELWLQAKLRLDNIHKTDRGRVRILNEIIAYCQERLSCNK